MSPATAIPAADAPSPAPAVRALSALTPGAHAAALVALGARPQAALAASTALARAVLLRDEAFAGVAATLPGWLRPLLPLAVAPPPEARVVAVERGSDATHKLAIALEDGAVVEAVIIPSQRGGAGGRTTLCVSSQVGCGRRCAFCATGTMGLRRNLRTEEIVAQWIVARRLWADVRGAMPPLGNVVFMGMGEPLDNLDAVVDAIDVLRDDRVFGLAAHRITVSTIGVADGIAELLRRSPARLALSLHAPDDARRAALMPVHRKTDLQRLRTSLLEALPAGREVLVAYILFKGFNDADADADALAAWLRGVPARLNLIPANPGPDPSLVAPSDDVVRRFQRRLLDRGVRALVRWPHGRDVRSACGQLALQRVGWR